MTSLEFTESLAFERLEPDPSEETVRLLGLLVTYYANQHRDPQRKVDPYTFDDFVPDPYAPSKQERQQAFAALLASYAPVKPKRKN